jgi:hypothetical protein
MKKQKTIVPFDFKDMTHQQMVDYLNENHPISLKHNEDLVNRVFARYPVLDKSEVGIIINFNSLFFDTKLHFFNHRRDGRILPSLKVRISTPPKLRKHDR